MWLVTNLLWSCRISYKPLYAPCSLGEESCSISDIMVIQPNADDDDTTLDNAEMI